MKKRSKSQAIGEYGESVFRTFALKNDLLPNKVCLDYGLDFLCQTVTTDIAGNQQIGPSAIGVTVKTSSVKTNRIRSTLSNDDCQFLLRCEFPVLIILINSNNSDIYYKFLDIGLMRLFHDMIINKKSTFTISPSNLNSDEAMFPEYLRDIANPDYQSKLRIAFASLQLNELIGPNKLIVRHTSGDSVLVVQAGDLYGSLKHLPREEFLVARNTLLCAKLTTEIYLPLSNLKRKIAEQTTRIAKHAVLIHDFNVGEARLFVRDSEGNTASCTFEQRRFGDEISYYHPAGLAITLSDCRLNNAGQHYHEITIKIESDSKENLFECPELLQFLIRCQEDSMLFVGKIDENGLSINHFPRLVQIGLCAEFVHEIYNELNISNPQLPLSSLEVWEFRLSLGFLASIIKPDRSEDVLPGATIADDCDEIVWKPGELHTFFCLSLPDGPTIVEANFRGRIGYVYNKYGNKAIGLRFDKYIAMSLLGENDIDCPIVNEYNKPYIIFGNNQGIVINVEGVETVETKYPLSTTYIVDDQF